MTFDELKERTEKAVSALSDYELDRLMLGAMVALIRPSEAATECTKETGIHIETESASIGARLLSEVCADEMRRRIARWQTER